MKKVDPNKVVDRFQTAVADSLKSWMTVDTALAGQPVATRRIATTDAFVRLAVTWESFLSNWWIAAINRDPTTFVSRLDKRLREIAAAEMGLQAGDLSTALVARSHLTVEDVRRLADPNGENLVFRSRTDLRRAAERDLAANYRARVTAITSGAWQVADLTRLCRNALVHQSQRALAEINTKLVEPTTKPDFRWTGSRRLDVRGLRRYLRTPEGDPRIVTFHNELTALAAVLKAPPSGASGQQPPT